MTSNGLPLPGKLYAEDAQEDDQADSEQPEGEHELRPPRLPQLLDCHLAPEDHEARRRGEADHDHRREIDGALGRPAHEPGREEDEPNDDGEPDRNAERAHAPRVRFTQMDGAGNYDSGDDYVVEFLGYRFSFNADDFEQRVTAAAVKLGLLGGNELDDDETADLVELVERDGIDEPRSTLGRYLVRHWEDISLVEGEALVYWLKKLVFRGAWLDHRVKAGKLEVGFDEESAEFSYHDPHGGRALLELLPTPSWHEVQYRR